MLKFIRSSCSISRLVPFGTHFPHHSPNGICRLRDIFADLPVLPHKTPRRSCCSAGQVSEGADLRGEPTCWRWTLRFLFGQKRPLFSMCFRWKKWTVCWSPAVELGVSDSNIWMIYATLTLLWECLDLIVLLRRSNLLVRFIIWRIFSILRCRVLWWMNLNLGSL